MAEKRMVAITATVAARKEAALMRLRVAVVCHKKIESHSACCLPAGPQDASRLRTRRGTLQPGLDGGRG